MRVFSRGTLIKFWEKYPKSEKQLRALYDILKKNEFKNSNEIIEVFNTADVIKDGKIVFNICHNDYRLIIRFRYEKHLAFILFIGTHKEYDRLDVDKL
jgi:mRNA interferase HigB